MGLAWPLLLMYGSHDMRHTSFRMLTVVNGTPRVRGITVNESNHNGPLEVLRSFDGYPFFQTFPEDQWMLDRKIFTFEAFINMMAKDY